MTDTQGALVGLVVAGLSGGCVVFLLGVVVA